MHDDVMSALGESHRSRKSRDPGADYVNRA
jgi:hypothetical protein